MTKENEPMAWAVIQPDSYSVFSNKLLAKKQQEFCMGGEIIPLYRKQQPTLTDDQYEAIKLAASWCEYSAGGQIGVDVPFILRTLLE